MAALKKCEMVPELPDEIIFTHILPRLPSKSIGRFRCVSKPWLSLLSTTKFARTHLKLHTSDPENIIIQCHRALRILNFSCGDAISRMVHFPTLKAPTSCPYRRRGRKVGLPLFQRCMWSRLCGSCDGLILIQTNCQYFVAILMNPITLESHILEDSSCPVITLRTYGLGYDSSSDDYKIVKVSYTGWAGYVDIFSMKVRTWRRIEHTPFRHSWEAGVFHNGCIHWIGGDPQPESCPTIVAVNLAREEVEQMPLPTDVVANELKLHLNVIKGRLALIHHVDSMTGGSVDIWIMEVYGKPASWTKFSFNFPNRGLDVRHVVSCMLNGDEILVERISDKHLLAYNWRSGVWRDVVVAGDNDSYGFTTLMTFRGSALSPNPRIRA